VTRKGEIRVLFAAKRREGPFEVIGRWTDLDNWNAIAEETCKRVNPEDMKVLISDGGPGIEKAFKLEHMEHQRCRVHSWRKLKIFLHLDGLKKAQQEKHLEKMASVPVFEYSKHSALETLSPKDKPEVKKLSWILENSSRN
jgi:transposase-like protein